MALVEEWWSVDADVVDLLERLAGEHPEWGPIEFIDGALHIQPMTSELHNLVLFALGRVLHAVRPPGHRAALDTYHRAGTGRFLRPDVMVYRTCRPPELSAVPEVPLAVVEVLSADRDHDLVTKQRLYAFGGVAHYSVIDLRQTEGWWAAERIGGARQARPGEPFTFHLPGWPPVVVTLDELTAG